MKNIKKTIVVAALLLIPGGFVVAQVVRSNQIIGNPPGIGVIMSTSTATGSILSASSSPTVGYITATTTTATSTLIGGISIGKGVLFSNFNCSALTNSGKLTVDSNGNVICSNDVSGSGGTSPVGTSTSESPGTLAYWTTTSATPALLGKVSTTTLSGSGPISVTAGATVIAGSPISVSCPTCNTSSASVSSVATNNGLTGGTITTTGTIGFDLTKIVNNTLLVYNGSQLQATGTPALTVGYLIATSTTATSTFANGLVLNNGALGVATSTPGQSAAFGVSGSAFIKDTVYAANFYDTALGGTSCVSENGGLLGTSNCVSSIASSGSTITVSSPTGAVNVDFNLAHSNAWTALQTFTNASTTQLTLRGPLYDFVNTQGASSTVLISNGTNAYWQKLATSQLTNDSGFVTSSGVTSVATNNGLTGGTITTTGTIGLDVSKEVSNTLQWWNGTQLQATGTPSLTAGYYISTTTTASTFPYASTTALTIGGTMLYGDYDKAAFIASTTIDTTANSYSLGTSTWNVWNPSRAVTATKFYCKTDTGTSVAWIGTGAASTTPIKCTSSGVGVTSQSVSFAANANVWLSIGSQASSNGTTVTATFTSN